MRIPFTPNLYISDSPLHTQRIVVVVRKGSGTLLSNARAASAFYMLEEPVLTSSFSCFDLAASVCNRSWTTTLCSSFTFNNNVSSSLSERASSTRLWPLPLKKLAPRGEEHPDLLPELERTMALLAFDILKLRALRRLVRLQLPPT